MFNSTSCYSIFEQSIRLYHKLDHVDQSLPVTYAEGTTEKLLFNKNWIDTVQWHLEDIIRDPAIDPVIALGIKRRIDKSNQERTDLVEQIDHFIYSELQRVATGSTAPVNTETPAWAIDRLSILALKIYHMQEQAARTDASDAHRISCTQKLAVLQEQKSDLAGSIDRLLEDLHNGRKQMKLYKQMKMYNDPALNPVLYKK